VASSVNLTWFTRWAADFLPQQLKAVNCRWLERESYW